IRTVMGSATIWDLATGDSLGQIPSDVLGSFELVGDDTMVSASFGGHLGLWDARPSAALPEFRAEPGPAAVAARFIDDDTVAGVWREELDDNASVVVRRWRRGAGADERRWSSYTSRISPAISPDG